VLRLEQIRAFLRNKNLRAVAEDSDIDYQAWRRVYLDLSKPQYDTLAAMSDYVESQLRLIQGGE
jgi:ribosomal protein L19E